MNPFYTDICPLCNSELLETHVGNLIYYQCTAAAPTGNRRNHYIYSWSKKLGLPLKAEIMVPDFCLDYGTDRTYIYKIGAGLFGPFTYICKIDGHFPINWNKPEQTSQRIKNLLIFS